MNDCKMECKGSSCNYRGDDGSGCLVVIVMLFTLWASCDCKERSGRIEKKVDQIHKAMKLDAEKP